MTDPRAYLGTTVEEDGTHWLVMMGEDAGGARASDYALLVSTDNRFEQTRPWDEVAELANGRGAREYTADEWHAMRVIWTR